MKDEIRVSFSLEDFRKLVRGEVVVMAGMSQKGEGKVVFVLQQDVGFDMMLEALKDAVKYRRG